MPYSEVQTCRWTCGSIPATLAFLSGFWVNTDAEKVLDLFVDISATHLFLGLYLMMNSVGGAGN